MTNTLMLEKIIDNSGLKRNFIATQMGISSYTLSLKINNKKEFKASEIDRLCTILKINVASRMQIFFAPGVDFKSTSGCQ